MGGGWVGGQGALARTTMGNFAMSSSAPWLTGPVLLEVWMNAGTVSQLKAGPLHDLHTAAEAAVTVTVDSSAVNSCGSATIRRDRPDAIAAAVSRGRRCRLAGRSAAAECWLHAVIEAAGDLC